MSAPHRTRSALRYGYPWATVGLGPILLAQGIYLRRTVLRLPEPEGERSGVEGQGQNIRVRWPQESTASA